LPSDHRTFRFYVTDSTDKFKRLASRFLGRQVDNVEHVDLEEPAPAHRPQGLQES
jgi:glutamate racemase